MKFRLLNIFTGIFLFYSFSLKAQIQLPSYEELCKYDSNYCDKAKGKLKPELVVYYKKLRSQIIQIAKLYKVDPVTLAMAPITENSLNVSVDDEVQDFLVKSKLASSARVFGHSFTIGPGQINMDPAMEVEEAAAKIEGRSKRTEQEVAQELLTPIGALKYAAALLKHAETTYSAVGLDISKRPEILTTLYNIGKNSTRAQVTKTTGKVPRPNYFGYFTGLHYSEIQKALNLPSVLDENFDFVALSTSSKFQVERSTYSVDKLEVFQFPPLCESSRYTKPFGAKTFINGEYEIVSRLSGCDFGAFVMLTDIYGHSGWIAVSDLDKAKQQDLKTDTDPFIEKPCENIPAKSCEATLSQLKNKYRMNISGDATSFEVANVMGVSLKSIANFNKRSFFGQISDFTYNGCGGRNASCINCYNFFIIKYKYFNISVSKNLSEEMLKYSNKSSFNLCRDFFRELLEDSREAVKTNRLEPAGNDLLDIYDSNFLNDLNQNKCVSTVELPYTNRVEGLELDKFSKKFTFSNTRKLNFAIKNSCPVVLEKHTIEKKSATGVTKSGSKSSVKK